MIKCGLQFNSVQGELCNSLMAFSMINCLNTLMEQLLLYFFKKLSVLLIASFVFPTEVVLYLNDWELKISLLSMSKSALLSGTSSLLNCYQLHDVSE